MTKLDELREAVKRRAPIHEAFWDCEDCQNGNMCEHSLGYEEANEEVALLAESYIAEIDGGDYEQT
jgi:hypothetical protein